MYRQTSQSITDSRGHCYCGNELILERVHVSCDASVYVIEREHARTHTRTQTHTLASSALIKNAIVSLCRCEGSLSASYLNHDQFLSLGSWLSQCLSLSLFLGLKSAKRPPSRKS